MLAGTQIEYSLGRISPDAVGLAASDKSGTATISKGLRVAARFFFDIGVEDLITDLNAAQIPIDLFRCGLIAVGDHNWITDTLCLCSAYPMSCRPSASSYERSTQNAGGCLWI